MNKVVSAGGIIIKMVDSIPQILLVYFNDEPYRDNVTFPKGPVKQGESEETAAVREVVEETGLQNPIIARELGVVTRPAKEESGEMVSKDIHLFLMRVESFVHGEAEERYGWFTYEEALAKLSFQQENDFIKEKWSEIVE